MRQIAITPGQGRPVVSLYGSGREAPPVEYQRQRVEERAERQPIPYVTYALTAINIVIFLCMMAVGHGRIDAVAEPFGAKVNNLIHQGQWWRLLTPMFLHGSWLHLGSNMLSLVWFGSGIERIYGARKYLLVYFAAGVAGNLVSYLHSPALSLGASGAIFGLVGAGLMFPIRFRSLLAPDAPKKILSQILPIAVINLYIGSTTPAIDNWAHMGGLVGGAFVALFLIPDALTNRQPPRTQDIALTAACVAVLLLTLLAGFKQWQVGSQEWKLVALDVPVNTYQVGSQGDTWWHLDVPEDWKPVDGSVAWTGPKGDRLEVTDSTGDPRLLSFVQETSRSAKSNLVVDGHPAWKVHAKINDKQSDLVLVPIYDRVVEFIFDPSEPAGNQYRNIVNQILRSVHFDHAPKPNAPVTP